MRSAFLHCLFIFCTAVEFLQGAFCLPLFFLTFTGAISSITPLTFELKESRRKSTESADMLGVKDTSIYTIINCIIVFCWNTTNHHCSWQLGVCSETAKCMVLWAFEMFQVGVHKLSQSTWAATTHWHIPTATYSVEGNCMVSLKHHICLST